MVREHEGEYSPFSHCDALSPSEIVLGHNPIGYFVMSAHKVGGHAADGGFHAVTVPVSMQLQMPDAKRVYLSLAYKMGT